MEKYILEAQLNTSLFPPVFVVLNFYANKYSVYYLTLYCYFSSESPEIKPKFVKGGKRYGRRSTPELIEPISDLTETTHVKPADEEDLEDNYDSAVPRKREVKG